MEAWLNQPSTIKGIAILFGTLAMHLTPAGWLGPALTGIVGAYETIRHEDVSPKPAGPS
jgi:putative effector of murein hydrolase LrgA (UPF0299 family)